jgi:WhiB family redox-sensing transcriptional regulator
MVVGVEWRDEAACRPYFPHREHWWFPVHAHSRDRWRTNSNVQAAKRVCAGCPVRAACLAEELAWMERTGLSGSGVWGGLDPFERSELVWGVRGIGRPVRRS